MTKFEIITEVNRLSLIALDNDIMVLSDPPKKLREKKGFDIWMYKLNRYREDLKERKLI